MPNDNNAPELYRRYRPTELDEIFGQEAAVAQLRQFLTDKNTPHALLFSGPSGCGKTTLARIMARELGAVADHDLVEVNAASSRGIDTIREIQDRAGLSAWGECRVWIIDEAHQLTKKAGGDAQTALLKTLEDVPESTYFMLCTTDPNQLLKTIRTRCTEIKVTALSDSTLGGLLVSIAELEEKKVEEKVIQTIVEQAEGSARQALVLLGKVINLTDTTTKLAALAPDEVKKQAVDLCRVLCNARCKWKDAADILKQIEEEPETVRRIILSYVSAVLLNGGKNQDRLFLILDCFNEPVFYTGKAGLVRAAYDVYRTKE